MNNCKHCGKETKNPKFCSSSCSASSNNKGIVRNGKPKGNCLYCLKKLEYSETKYCSVRCMQDFLYSKKIEKWKVDNSTGTMSDGTILRGFVKRYIWEKYDKKCSRCGWNETNEFTGKIPLEIEHIDGNHLNNNEDNLILLCPNCHSLTSTYKGANRGRGRTARRNNKN
jgi:Zn finger protein HypA/HybF involved in hydrogenase expression